MTRCSKCLVLVAISFFSLLTASAQIVERAPVDSSLLKAIDWYIESTSKCLSEIANENNRIISNGIVVVEFLNQRDTIEIIRDSLNRVKQVSYPRIYTFWISMFSMNLAKSHLPSYYFIRGKTPVIIYTGIEDFFKQDEEGFNKYKSQVLNPTKGFHLISFISTYLIEITNSKPNEFKVKEVPGTISRYYSK